MLRAEDPPRQGLSGKTLCAIARRVQDGRSLVELTGPTQVVPMGRR